MDSNLWFMLIFQLLLISLNAFFACAEIAVISVSAGKLEKLADDGNKRAKILLKLTQAPAKFLSTIQVGITLAGFIGSAFAADNFSDPLVSWLIDIGIKIPIKTLDAISVVIITLILSYFTLVFGELVPKRVAMRNSEKIALGLAGFVSALAALFAPIVWLLTVSTNGVLRLIGIDPNQEDEDVSEDDIRVLVDTGAKNGVIDSAERDFIENVFEFDDLTAGEVATHRTDVTMLWLDETEEEWNKIIHEKCHMFYPVCNESVDDVVGVLYLKDYFRLGDINRENVMQNAVKTPYFVPESVKADVLFRNMKEGGKSFAVVIDEYGGMRGIVTMNDLITRLVGNLGDETVDENEVVAEISKIDENKWKLKGNVSLDEIAEALNIDLPVDDYETFSGMVFSEIGSIPDDGEQPEIEAFGLKISVLSLIDHQIEEAEITILQSEDISESNEEKEQ